MYILYIMYINTSVLIKQIKQEYGNRKRNAVKI